jgi:urease accessory protein
MIASALVRARELRSEIHRGSSAGPLRLLFPRAGDAAWIVTSSFGGGLVDGDAAVLEIAIDAGATAVVTSQASQKVYKGVSSQRTSVRAGEGATALVVPDPVVPFRGAHFTQTTSIELAAGASLALADVVTAGRVACGERWAAERIATSLELAIAGERVLLDRVVLDRHAAARMRRFDALATAILVGPRFRELAAAALARIAGEPVAAADVVVAASPLADGALVRLAGSIAGVVAATRGILGPACALAGEDPWARRW